VKQVERRIEYIEHPMIKPQTVERRLYQERIAETATDYNTLVILPTALGKTIISALVVAELLYRYRKSKILVMAPTRPLVLQHLQTFLNVLNLRKSDVVILTGEIPPVRRAPQWRGSARLVFATPQVVRNDLKEGRCSLREFCLVVFDECHRAVGRYAYTEIAGMYAEQARYPLILGMTASPGSKMKRILEVAVNLYIEQVEYRTEADADVEPYIQSVKLVHRIVNLPHVYMAARSQIRSLLEKRLNKLRFGGYIRRGNRYVSRRELVSLGHQLRYRLEMSIEEERGRLFNAIRNQSLSMTIYHMLGLLETQGIIILKGFMDQVEEEKAAKSSYRVLVKEPEYLALRELVNRAQVEHPKAELLKEIVEEQLLNYPVSRMLVFAQYRDTAQHLVNLLEMIPDVRPARFVGQERKPGDIGLSQDEQSERIAKLRNGELNVLVATSIGEEGLDIPSVDHVVFYEPIPSGIRYIQRKGRTGRRGPGKVTILAAEDTLDTVYLRSSSRQTEKMRKITASVQNRLPEVVRRNPRPSPEHMTAQEIWIAGEEAESDLLQEVSMSDTIIIDLGPEKPKASDKSTSQVAESLYYKLLETGSEGAHVAKLKEELKTEHVDEALTESALKKLEKEKAVTETKTGVYIPTTVLKDYGQTHTVYVKRVRRGYAEVVVDDKHQAVLYPEEYDGPRGLLKKGSRFEAISELYKESTGFNIWVKEVTRILNKR
jgi:Fanconi anemia group M protein